MDQTIVENNSAARDRLQALIARLSDEELDRDIGDGWTVAASLAHVAFWDRRAATLLDRWQRDGVSPSPVDVDAINDALLPQWRLIPPRAAAEDAVAAAEAIDGKIAAVPPSLLTEIRETNGIRLDRAHHRGAHIEEIERLLG